MTPSLVGRTLTCCFHSSLSVAAALFKTQFSDGLLDGEVDFGTTTLKVEIRDGDSFETKLKGRVALTGVCSPSDSNCQLQLILAELRPVQDPLPIITTKQRTVSGLFVRNANTWTGTRTMNGTSNDGLINIDATSKLALEANIDGKNQGVVLNANAYGFKAHLYYRDARVTSTGTAFNNRIAIGGQFSDENTRVTLNISIWATDCRPVVHPKAWCMLVPDTTRGSLHLDSTFDRLGDMQSSQDLCDASLAPDPVKVCAAGGSLEFPPFSCTKQPIAPPGSPPAELLAVLYN